MKRAVAIVTGLVLIWYIGAIMYPLFPKDLRTQKTKFIFKSMRLNAGLGSLFNKPGSVQKKLIIIRFFENGIWQKKHNLLQPMFEEYIDKGNFSALKHCRLDANLIYNIYTICEANGMEQAQKSSAYSEFITHIFAFHKTESIPDSLDISYYRINNDNTSKLLLNFKSTP